MLLSRNAERSYHNILYHIVDHKRQNRLKVGTEAYAFKIQFVYQMMMSGKDFLKSHVLRWRRKVYSDWEDVTSLGRALQVFGLATGKARLPTVDRLTGGVVGDGQTIVGLSCQLQPIKRLAKNSTMSLETEMTCLWAATDVRRLHANTALL